MKIKYFVESFRKWTYSMEDFLCSAQDNISHSFRSFCSFSLSLFHFTMGSAFSTTSPKLFIQGLLEDCGLDADGFYHILVKTDVEPDDLAAILVLQWVLAHLNYKIKWTFLVGEGNPKTKERLLHKSGVEGDVILGLASGKKHPDTIPEDGDVLKEDQWLASADRTALATWLANHPTGMIITIKPPREFLLRDPENDKGLAPLVFPSEVFTKHTMLYYGSFNFRSLFPRGDDEKKVVVEALQELLASEKTYIFETFLSLGPKNSITGADAQFPWDKLKQTMPGFFDILYSWNNSQSQAWIKDLGDFGAEVVPTWEDDDKTRASSCILCLPNEVVAKETKWGPEFSAAKGAEFTEYDLFALSKDEKNTQEIFDKIYTAVHEKADFAYFWRKIKGLSNVLPELTQQFVNADTGLVSALLLPTDESTEHLASVDAVKFAGPGYTAPQYTEIYHSDSCGKIWAPDMAAKQRNQDVDDEKATKLKNEFRQLCVDTFAKCIDHMATTDT